MTTQNDRHFLQLRTPSINKHFIFYESLFEKKLLKTCAIGSVTGLAQTSTLCKAVLTS